MLHIIEINNDNKYLLENFINNKLPNTFRYFQKRTIDIINNHKLTLLLIDENNQSYGYAHIDNDSNKYWFGICILDEYQNKGYGKKIMNYIFNKKEIIELKKIYLSVDKINKIAINLYNKYNFNIIEENSSYYIMVKNI